LDSEVVNAWVNQKFDFTTRYVRIFYSGIFTSQRVPSIDKSGNWVIQYERQGIWKNPNMGWTYTSDTQSRRPVFFKELEEALAYCRELGLGYEINYPRFRYHSRKNYGDNFKWRGNPKEDDF